MDEDQARARMAQDDIIGWVAVNATGPLGCVSWDQATATLGQGIHVELTWLDVNGTISGLYETGDQFAFTDLRVSRSFQGKIEHTDDTPVPAAAGRWGTSKSGCNVHRDSA